MVNVGCDRCDLQMPAAAVVGMHLMHLMQWGLKRQSVL
jgi:hypothetical protein